MRGRSHQPKGRNQARIGQNAQGTGVLVRDESSRTHRAKEDGHHAVGARGGRSLAGTAVNVHRPRLRRGSDRAQGPPSERPHLDVGQGPPSASPHLDVGQGPPSTSPHLDVGQGPPSASPHLDVGQGPPSPAASWVGPPNSGRATISMRSAEPHQRQVIDSMVSLRTSVSSTEGSPAISRCQNSRTRDDRTMSNRVRLPQCAQRRRLLASGRVTDTLEPYRSHLVLMSAP